MRPAPWHVKGVAPAAQESAQEAARRSGLSVGEWLNSVIFRSIDKRPPRQHPRERVPDRPNRNTSGISDRLEHLTRQIERLAQTKTSASDYHGDETPHRLADAIVRLDRRLDQLIQEGRHANSEMERRVNGVDRALAALGEARLHTAFVAGPENVEQAVAEIAARQRVLDGNLSGPAAYAPPPRPGPLPPAPQRFETDMSGLEQQLRHITTQLELLQRPCRADEALAALRADLADIGRTISEAMPRRALEALEGEVRKLAAQIEAGRRSGSGESSVAGLERGLAEVRDALHGLTPAESLVGFDDAVKTLSRKVDMLSGGGPDPAALQQLESAIGGLRGIVSHVASGEALAALAGEVRALADRVERGTLSPGNDILLTLERRIATIAEAIETVRHEGRRAVPPGLDALMQSLSDKIEHLQLTRSDQLAFGNLEERITRLVEKLDSSEAKLGHLGAIERGMAELLVQLEELRSGQSARAPVGTRGAISAPPQSALPLSAPPMPVAPPPVVDALTRDVAQVKETQSVTGRRTEDSLESVQGTIGDVVSRLAMIESDLRTDSKLSTSPSDESAAETASTPAFSDSPAAPSDLSAEALSEPLSAPAAPPRQKPATAPRQPIDPSLPPDYPLEPGSGMPRSGISASPAARIAASEMPLRAAKASAPPPAPEDPSNYLQAARRAAQAASQQGSKGAADPDRSKGDAKTLSDRLKQLFVGAGIILALAASFRFAGIYLDPDRVILADAPAPRGDVAPPPSQFPATARTIAVPDQLLAADAPTPLPRTPPAITNGPAFVSAPPAAALATERPAAVATPTRPAPRTEVTGSVPAKPPAAAAPAATPSAALAAAPAVAPAATPLEPAPAAAPPAAEPPAAGISNGLKAAGTAGDPVAAHEIATHYAEGRGVSQSYREAAVWFERAAKRGLAPSQFRLGTMYEKGLGVPKNLPEARRLYLAAADKGNAKAMHNIAVLYAEGIDGKPDYKAAAQWFRKGADYGIADSQYNLAVLHARGIGVEQNLSESFKWFTLAANSGDQEAAKKRDEVATRLDKQALTAARLAAQSWTAAAAPEEAMTVKPPAGGWEQAAVPAAPAGKPKPRPRGHGPTSAAR